MANTRTIECLILPVNPHMHNNPQRKVTGTGDVSVLQVQSAQGVDKENLIFRKGQKITLSFSDKIKCLSGRVFLFFHANPNSSRLHILSAQPNGEKEKIEVEVNEQTTKQTTQYPKLALTGVNHRVHTGIVIGREGFQNPSVLVTQEGKLIRH